MLAGVAMVALAAAQAAGAVEIRSVAPDQFPQVGAVVRVVDINGRAVPGLGRADFTVSEDGQPVTDYDVRPSFREGGSLAVEILIDTSGSMDGAPLQAAAAAAAAFLSRLGPDDRVGLITFGSPPVERAQLGAPPAISGLDQLVADGYTSLYGAINLAIARLASEQAKSRAIVVLTDGRDDEGDRRSDQRFDQLRQAVSGSTIPIHALGFTSPEFDSGPLRELAGLTHGTYRDTDNPAELAALYRQIADDLLAEYRISYRSSAVPGPHRLQIGVDAPGLETSSEKAFVVVGGQPPVTTPLRKSPPRTVPVLLLVLVPLGVVGVALCSIALASRRRRRSGSAGDPMTPNGGMILEGPGVTIPLSGGSILIGRDPDAQVIVDDPVVSRQHARLQVTAEGLWVQDLGSSNGTLVNGVAVTSSLMHPGDVLEIGDLRLRLRDDR